jgi:hypothetical protein
MEDEKIDTSSLIASPDNGHHILNAIHRIPTALLFIPSCVSITTSGILYDLLSDRQLVLS